MLSVLLVVVLQSTNGWERPPTVTEREVSPIQAFQTLRLSMTLILSLAPSNSLVSMKVLVSPALRDGTLDAHQCTNESNMMPAVVHHPSQCGRCLDRQPSLTTG